MLAIDPMHNLYLGTAKHIFRNIWMKTGTLSSESIETINESIESRSFTAEQWLIWVNYYSLYELLPDEELECWRHFVLASRLLCKSSLSLNDLSVADALLLQTIRTNLYF